MRTVPLSDNLPDDKMQADNRSEEASIHAEIAERILELKELVGFKRAYGFFEKLRVIFETDHAAYWICLRIMTGDLSQINLSYSEQGKRDARSKQAAQQELERAIVAIRGVYPEVANAIVDIRRVSAKLSDSASEK